MRWPWRSSGISIPEWEELVDEGALTRNAFPCAALPDASVSEARTTGVRFPFGGPRFPVDPRDDARTAVHVRFHPLVATMIGFGNEFSHWPQVFALVLWWTDVVHI